MTDMTREEIARIIANHFAANFDVMFKDKQDYLRHSGQHKSGHTWGVNGPFQDDCLYAADDVLQALDARDGWRPISEAPKDGTKILICTKAYKGRRRMAVDYWHSTSRGSSYDGFGHANEHFFPATHWMPLPDFPTPPTQAEEKSDG